MFLILSSRYYFYFITSSLSQHFCFMNPLTELHLIYCRTFFSWTFLSLAISHFSVHLLFISQCLPLPSPFPWLFPFPFQSGPFLYISRTVYSQDHPHSLWREERHVPFLCRPFNSFQFCNHFDKKSLKWKQSVRQPFQGHCEPKLELANTTGWNAITHIPSEWNIQWISTLLRI